MRKTNRLQKNTSDLGKLYFFYLFFMLFLQIIGLSNKGGLLDTAWKAGVIGLTKTWAKEFARKGAAVRVNCIAPGYTMTDMLKTVPQELLDKFAAMTMLKRLGQPEEIASAALFLVSDEASYVTGQVLAVNGGMRL